ncbi:MAG: DUF4345 domain-containing protein [Gammaproteobacteria bacterium]|nr:DUF4345 domain-containing protein [Gammaproteobacteria bacterium]
MNYRKAYLWISAVGLIPIALSYGVAPEQSLSYLFGFVVESPNEAHVFRGVMGLYLGMVVLWIIGAVRESFERTAILSEIFFMGGLAVGRTISVLVDGWPHWLLVAYIFAEAALAIVGIMLLRRPAVTSQ